MVRKYCQTSNTGDSRFCKHCGRLMEADAFPAFVPVTRPARLDESQNASRLQQLMEMALWHSDAGNVDAAIRACRAALLLNPTGASALSLLASLYERAGDIDKAVQTTKQLVQLNPGSVTDAENLDRLREDLALNQLKPPRYYRWIPPALASFVAKTPNAPAIGAGAVAVTVAFFGLVAVLMLTPRPRSNAGSAISSPRELSATDSRR